MPEVFHDATIRGDSQRICQFKRQAFSPQHFPIPRVPGNNFYNLLMLLERLILGLPFACLCDRPYLGALLVSFTFCNFLLFGWLPSPRAFGGLALLALLSVFKHWAIPIFED